MKSYEPHIMNSEKNSLDSGVVIESLVFSDENNKPRGPMYTFHTLKIPWHFKIAKIRLIRPQP